MPKSNFLFMWSERRAANIEAETEAEALAIYEAGDYDSDFLYEHDFTVVNEEEVKDA